MPPHIEAEINRREYVVGPDTWSNGVAVQRKVLRSRQRQSRPDAKKWAYTLALLWTSSFSVHRPSTSFSSPASPWIIQHIRNSTLRLFRKRCNAATPFCCIVQITGCLEKRASPSTPCYPGKFRRKTTALYCRGRKLSTATWHRSMARAPMPRR